MTGSKSPSDLRIHGSEAPPATLGDRIVDALRDPLAMQIFDALTAGEVTPATVPALCDHLGADRTEVERRLERLTRWDLVEPAAPAGEGGEVAYRHTRDSLISDEEWGQLPLAQRRRLTAVTLDLFDEYIGAAFDRGGFDADDTHLSRLPADLDRQGYDDMVRLTLEMLERARDIQAEVVNRRADGTSDGESIATELIVLHYQQGAPTADDRPRDVVELREEFHGLVETIAEESPRPGADFRALAGHGRALARLARRIATRSHSRPAARGR